MEDIAFVQAEAETDLKFNLQHDELKHSLIPTIIKSHEQVRQTMAHENFNIKF